MEKVVIAGAGIAGLVCLNALVDAGVEALLLEAGTIGTPKICGEFLAPQAALQLEAWGIGPLQKISQIALYAHPKKRVIDFQAAAMSRSQAELLLAKRAKERGANILEKAPIKSISPTLIELASGTEIVPSHLFIATGKVFGKPTSFPYIGLKSHIPKEASHHCLEMHLFKGGYMGIVPISESLTNVACLIKRGVPVPDGKWLEAAVPEFGIRRVASWPNSYFIGDACGSLPPACGGGFNHAIASSLLAVRYFLQNDPEGYRKAILTDLEAKMPWAMGLHRAMLSPFFSKLAITVLWPKAIKQLMNHIGLSYV